MSKPARMTQGENRVGIVNPYGQLWTWDTFETAEAAEQHLRDFWRDLPNGELHRFKLCVVRVDIVPISEPFALPSQARQEPQP